MNVCKYLFLILFLISAVNVRSQASAYTFSLGTETYSQITGTTSTAVGDNGMQSSIPIGFTFVFSGRNYTHFAITTNNFIKLGNGSTTINGVYAGRNNYFTNQPSSAQTVSPFFPANNDYPIIAPMWDDGNLSTAFSVGEIRYNTTGTAPNRILNVNWHNTKLTTYAYQSAVSMIVRLYETTNVIEMVYSSPFTSYGGMNGSIGLQDSASFLSVNPVAPITASNTVAYNTIDINTSSNLAGKKITFTPPPPCTSPTSLAASVFSTSKTNTTISGSFTAAPSAPTGYIVVRSNSSTQPTSLTLGTALPSVGNTTAFGSGTRVEYVGTNAGSWNSTGLTAGTVYYYYVFSYNNAACIGGPAYSSSATSFIQSTDCNSFTVLPYTESFTSYLPSCWNNGLLGNISSGPSSISSNTNKWVSDGFLNNDTIGAARINIFTNNQINWLFSPRITIPNTGYVLKYIVGATQAETSTALIKPWEKDDSVCVLISTTGYTGWSILKTYKSINVPSSLGQIEAIDLSAYSGQNVRIAFMAVEGSYDGSAAIDFFVDSLIIQQMPAPTISSVTSTNSCAANTKIVIIGSDLNNVSSATIGSQSLLPFDSISSTRLVKTISTPLNGTTSISNNIGTATNATNITFTNAPALSVDSNNFSICNGSSATVNVTSTLANYTSYSWSPASGVSGSTSATFNPTATTTYTLSATNSSTGCFNTLSRTISVDNLPSSISLSQGNSRLDCYNNLDSLSLSGGLASIIGNVGAATSTSVAVSTSSSLGPNPMQSFYGGSKMQMLYLASELTALGMVSGSQINSISINMPSVETRSLLDYTIKSKLTNITALTSTFETGLSTRLTLASYQPVVGVNTFTFTTPITWDGNSNVVFEFAFSNNDDGGFGGSTATFAPTSFVSSSFYFVDNSPSSNVSSATSATYTYSSRNNTSIGFLKPANYSWSPTTGLYNNRALTMAYTSTSINKVYTKSSATQKYYLIATNGTCVRRDSIIDSIKNASILATLATSSVIGAIEQCSDANGWTYYASSSNPDQWLFGIYKNGNSFSANVDLIVNNVSTHLKSSSSNGANQEHASYTMSRYWNVNATGSVGSGVKVRFFIDPQDTTTLLNERNSDYNVLKNTTNPNTLAVKSRFEWFKTQGVPYTPSNWIGNKYNSNLIKLTQDTIATVNGLTYVELSGITSFSGGTGGAAFGPSNNGLFNSGGMVGLPVSWKDVKATVKEEGNWIQWITSSEENTSHFEVEYSYDAKNFFKASNDIKAAGNSTTDKSYNYMHLEEYGELVYYRVKQVDLDGKVDYSKAVVAKRTSKLPEFHVSMYPVPLNVQDLNLKIQTVQKTDITITINDLLGRGVYTERVSPQGYTTDHKLSLGHLQNGTYYVTIDNGLKKSVQVLVVGK